MMGNWNAGLGFSCLFLIPVHNFIRSNTTKDQKTPNLMALRKKMHLGTTNKRRKNYVIGSYFNLFKNEDQKI